MDVKERFTENKIFDTGNRSSKIAVQSVIIVALLSAGYLLLSWLLVGFRSDEVLLVVIFNILFFLSAATRKFILGFSIFVVYWIIFDYMKAFPNYHYNTVHIADLYNLEKHFFGINYQGKIITPNEYCRIKGNTFLDILGGIFYLCWIPVPLAFAGYLFFTHRRQFLYFSLTFVLVNFLGFIVYYLYPAAPPWYVEAHGFVFYPKTHGSMARLIKFDNYFHAGIFKAIYAKGSNVFAAMPSLHSSYPVVVLYYGLKNRLGLINVFFGLVLIGIWCTAVYAGHHYILDVIAGILCAIAGIFIFNRLVSGVKFFREFIDRYEEIIR